LGCSTGVAGIGIVGLKAITFGLKALGAKSYLAKPSPRSLGFYSPFSSFYGENSTTGFTEGTKLEAFMFKLGLKANLMPSKFRAG